MTRYAGLSAKNSTALTAAASIVQQPLHGSLLLICQKGSVHASMVLGQACAAVL